MPFDVSIASFALGLISATSGWVIWWVQKINNDKLMASRSAAEAATKAYAAERDFQHIRRNQEQMVQSLEDILSEFDKRFDIIDRDILEMKAYLYKHNIHPE